MRVRLGLTFLVVGLLACERSRPPDASGGESAKSAPGGNIAVRTAESASVGDTEERVKQLYGDRLRVEPHKYTGPTGHYLIVQTVGDSLHRIVFETDGQRVLRFRAGRRPAVDYVEACG